MLDREDVDCPRVREVRRQVLERRLARGLGLAGEAQAREHGQAAVLELLDLEGLEVGALGVAEGVEDAAGVSGRRFFFFFWKK